MKVILIAVLVVSTLISPVDASEEAHEKVKLPASVVALDPEQGFKLSEAATARLQIRFQQLEGPGPWVVPRTTLVKVKRSTGVYRETNGFLTFVVVESTGSEGSPARISSEDLRAGDRVAVEGGAFLRVIDLDLSGGGGDSCGGG